MDLTNQRLHQAVEALAEKLLGKQGIVAINGEEVLVVMVEGDSDEATKNVPPLSDGIRTKIVSVQGLELHRRTSLDDAKQPETAVHEGVLRVHDWPVSRSPSLWLERSGGSISPSAILSGAGSRLVDRRVRVTVETIDDEEVLDDLRVHELEWGVSASHGCVWLKTDRSEDESQLEPNEARELADQLRRAANKVEAIRATRKNRATPR